MEGSQSRRRESGPAAYAACAGAEVCMMALPCRHALHCRPCWETAAREEGGEACTECGAACEVFLWVRRP